jgi:hypothetical protein
MYLLRSEEIRERCIREIKSLPALDNPQFVVEVKKYRKDKTAAQRNYFHKILDIVCDYTGDDTDEVKMQIKYAVLPLKKVSVKGSDYLYPISSEDTTTKQYADLISAALVFANKAGVTIPEKSHWGTK